MSFEDAIEKEIGRIPKSSRRKERGKIMVDISKHQLLKDISDLMQMIEEFPASDHQTATIIKAGEILDGIEALRAEIAALEDEMGTAKKYSVLRDNMTLKKSLADARGQLCGAREVIYETSFIALDAKEISLGKWEVCGRDMEGIKQALREYSPCCGCDGSGKQVSYDVGVGVKNGTVEPCGSCTGAGFNLSSIDCAHAEEAKRLREALEYCAENEAQIYFHAGIQFPQRVEVLHHIGYKGEGASFLEAVDDILRRRAE